MAIDKAIDAILAGNLDEMRTEFEASLYGKMGTALDERKIEVAQKFFSKE